MFYKREEKIEALKDIQYLAEVFPDVLIQKLHKFSLAVTKEVMNPRSLVSREAVVTLGHLSEHLQENMNSELKHIIAVLLNKSIETKLLICDEVTSALSKIVQNCSPARAMKALIEGGLR